MPSRRPNLLFLLADQHRADCLGAAGNRFVPTPALDGLAADGTRFAEAHCVFPVCTPARYTLLTGRYVHEHGGWDNHCTLRPSFPTLPRHLREQGYRTAAVGKMHYTPTYADVGFEEMVLCEQDGPGRWDDDYHRALLEAGLVDLNDLEDQRQEYRRAARPEYWETRGAMATNLPPAWHNTEWIGERALEQVDRWDADGGHCLFVGFVKPHHPFDAPPPWDTLVDPETVEIPPGWTPECLPRDIAFETGYFPHDALDEKAMRRVVAHYYGSIAQIDHRVGLLLDRLRERGLYDDTLVVYTSDHGEYMGFHHLLLKGGYMYDPLVRVPLLVKRPGERGAGRTTGALASQADIPATLLRGLGLTPPEGMPDADLFDPAREREAVYAESGCFGASKGAQRMIRTQKHKLIDAGGFGENLLFDLERDPLEMENRFDDPTLAEPRTRLHAALDAWRAPDAVGPTILDEDAPIIDRPNAQRWSDGHREAIIARTAARMTDHGLSPREAAG